ncbi:MAG: glycosyl hydrolase family 28-related protein [Niabella sp.]
MNYHIMYRVILLFVLLLGGRPLLLSQGMHPTSNVNPYQLPAGLITYHNNAPELFKKGFLDVTKEPYSARGDGLTDDTEAIQWAINDAFKGNFVVFFPGDKTYLLSDQLICTGIAGSRKFCHILIGSARGARPKLKLKDNSVLNNTDRIVTNSLIRFLCFKNGQPLPASLYGSTVRGIDIDMGNNPFASAISMAGAQHCVIEDVKITGANFYCGVYNLPGSGGGVVNLKVDGGRIGIWQDEYRPNPTIEGLTLSNQSQNAIRITNSRGPVIITGFKITGVQNPATDYRAVYLSNSFSKVVYGIEDHAFANLSLTDGQIEVNGPNGIAIENIAQDLTINNVYIRAQVLIKSGKASAEDHLVSLKDNSWNRLSSYVFTAAADRSAVYINNKSLAAPPDSNFIFYTPVVAAAPDEDFVRKHSWSHMPSWEDADIVNIMSYGATPENINNEDDDGAAIQKAIDEVTNPKHRNFGKTVFIPRGLFLTQRKLVLKKGLKMIGAAKNISVIQANEDWPNKKGAVMESVDEKEGNIILSDFAIIVYRNMSYLNFRSGNTIIRDIVTETVRKYGTDHTNTAGVPYIKFSNHAGGKVYHLSTDHTATLDKYDNKTYIPGYHLLKIEDTFLPLTFYQLSIEHIKNSPQFVISGSKNVNIFGLKFEEDRQLLKIIDSEDIRIIGGSGNYSLTNATDESIIRIEHSDNILIQNLNKRSVSDKEATTTYWLRDGTNLLSKDRSILMYKKGL